MAEAGVVERFVGRLRARHRLWRTAQAVVAQALVVALVVCLAELVDRGLTVPILAAGALWLVGVAVVTALRLRMPPALADRELGFGDRLLTYLGLPLGGEVSPFVAVLRDDLERQIAALPPQRTRALWRRPLGAVRYLLPIVIVLLLLRAFAPLAPVVPDTGPPMAGGGGGDAPSGSGGGGGGAPQDQQDGGGGAPKEQPEKQPEPPPEPLPEPPPPPTRAPAPPPAAPGATADEPKPLLQLDPADEFVVPVFVGDGATRKQLMRVAAQGPGEPSPKGASELQPKAQGRRPDEPPEPDPSFAHALEQALRARHVPEVERPFVRRYFEALAGTKR